MFKVFMLQPSNGSLEAVICVSIDFLNFIDRLGCRTHHDVWFLCVFFLFKVHRVAHSIIYCSSTATVDFIINLIRYISKRLSR